MSDWRTAVRETLADIEWLTFGNWDTPRCPFCLGWKKAEGHKPNCKRQALLEIAEQPEQLTMFGGEK